MEFPQEIYKQIGLQLSYGDLPAYCLAVNYSPDKIFWIDKAERDFSVKFSPEEISSQDRGEELYIKMAAYAVEPLIGVEKYLRSAKDIYQTIGKANQLGNFTLSDELLTRVYSQMEKLSNCGWTAEFELLLSICEMLKNNTVKAENNYLLSCQPSPVAIKSWTPGLKILLLTLDIIFDNAYYSTVFNDIVEGLIQDNEHNQVLRLMNIFYAFGNIRNLSYILKSCPDLLMLGTHNIYFATHMGNINTMPLLLSEMKNSTDANEFIKIINDSIQIARENDDERMIKLLTDYTV